MSFREFVNKTLNGINDLILKPLSDIESSVEGMLEILSEGLNVDKPRVITTLNTVNECEQGETGQCGDIGGRYIIDGSIILINYRITMNTLLHLYVHHLQSIETGRERFAQVRRTEELKLPWSLRPTEITAMYRTALLVKAIPPRIWKIYNDEVKPKIKEIDENLKEVEPLVNYLNKQVEHVVMEKHV